MAAENIQTGTFTVGAMSPGDEVIKFCLDNRIQRPVIDELLERGFDSLQALSLIDIEDLKTQKIPIGQRRLILHISKSLNNTTGQTTSSNLATAEPPSEEPGHSETGDVYHQTLINSLLSHQTNLAAENSTFGSDNSPNLSQPSWQDPQVHIANATGKSASPYYDICDFIPNAVEEELVVGGQGEQKLVIKSAPKKPKVENLTLSQWSVANLAILYKLVGEGKLVGNALMDYLSYTTKFYQLVQRCSLVSVLLYDREYRQLQASMGFRWGTDVQHLHTLHLQPRERQSNQGTNPKKSNQTPNPSKKPERREPGICRNFNSAKGCTYSQCRYKHICIIPGCGQSHPVSSHVSLKN